MICRSSMRDLEWRLYPIILGDVVLPGFCAGCQKLPSSQDVDGPLETISCAKMLHFKGYFDKGPCIDTRSAME